MMHMWFWFDTDLGTFLFPGYDVSTLWGFLATCLGLFSLAIVYEAMKVFQIKLHKKTVSALGSGRSTNSENSSLLTQVTSEVGATSTTNCNKWTRWIVEVLHWSAHTTLGYILMLAVMTYNAYIGITLVAGASLGYWLFGMTLIEMNIEQFREAKSKIDKCDPDCADAIGNEERRDSKASNAAEQLVTEVSAEIHASISS